MFEQSRELSVGSEEHGFGMLECLQITGGFEFAQGRLLQWFEFFEKIHDKKKDGRTGESPPVCFQIL